MKRRYTFDATSGLLVDRDGIALGRVVGITIETLDGGKGGNAVSSLSGTTEEKTNRSTEDGGVGEGAQRPTGTQLERAAIDRVWEHYLHVIPSKRRLDAKRTRIIRNALLTMRDVRECDLDLAEQLVKQAVLGLSRSPHHNGVNEQRKSYLEIRYALKGIGNESDDERIEKAIAWAAIHAPGAALVDEHKVERWLDEVRYYVGKRAHGSNSGRDRALAAYSQLKDAGFRVVRLSAPPWARVER